MNPEGGTEDPARFDWMLGEGLLYDEKITFDRGGDPLVRIEYSSRTDPTSIEWNWNSLKGEGEGALDTWMNSLWSAVAYGSAMPQWWRDSLPPTLAAHPPKWDESPRLEHLMTRPGPLARTCRVIATEFRAEPAYDPSVVGQAEQHIGTGKRDSPVESGTATVVRMILNALPELREDTPWQDILEFRQDPAARATRARLRAWMTAVAKENAAPAAIEDELIALLDDYEAHMKRHHIRTERGIVEAFLTTTAEVAPAVVTMKWGSAMKALFDVSRAEIALLEAEKDAPGRAVAYVAQARSRFS